MIKKEVRTILRHQWSVSETEKCGALIAALRKDEEVMVFNMLLMADSFALRGDTLLLKSGDKVMIELIASKQDINVKIAKKAHGKKDKKETKAKGPKKKSQKNGQPKVSQPSNQKHSQSNHQKKK